MKKIILCEGKTDATLLGYFLENKFNWRYEEKRDVRFNIQNNEVLKWYKRPDKINGKLIDDLAVWGVGGIDQLFNKLSYIIKITQNSAREDLFNKIALFFDHDERTNEECLDLVKNWFGESQINIKNVKFGQWLSANITLANSRRTIHQLGILSIVLPKDSIGDLEIFLADSLRNQLNHDYDRHLVDEARMFISKIPDRPYLYKRRYRSKAILGSILSVISPDMSTRDLSSKLSQIDWQKVESVSSVYSLLAEL